MVNNHLPSYMPIDVILCSEGKKLLDLVVSPLCRHWLLFFELASNFSELIFYSPRGGSHTQPHHPCPILLARCMAHSFYTDVDFPLLLLLLPSLGITTMTPFRVCSFYTECQGNIPALNMRCRRGLRGCT